jgi:hypothetical protein
MNPLLRETLSMVRSAGFTPAIDQRKHIHVRWTDSNGRKRRVVISRTPSDRNAHKKNRKIVKQQLSGKNKNGKY